MKIDAKNFDEIARTIFKPIYPVIAGQIIAHTGITKGVCLDLGCGGGYLGIEVAKVSELSLRFLDQSSDMLAIVERNLAETGLQERGEAILANVEQIPLPDASVNLAISRGSVFFWEDLAQAFKEVYRVLAPGGMTYIGGGFGSAALKDEITANWTKKGKDVAAWQNKVKGNLGPEMRQKMEQALLDASIANYEIVQNQEVGLWVVMRKEN